MTAAGTLLRTALLLAAALPLAGALAQPAAPEMPVPEAVQAAREQAEAASAAILSPGTYGDAVAALERARKAAAGRGDPARAAAGFAEAERLFRSAAAGTRLAGETFAEVLPAREAAQAAEAWRLVPERWQAAEAEFTAAARRLEKEDLEGARRRGATARDLYREAELQALRSRYLAGARAAILAAEEARAERHAPRTLAKARAFLAQAESTLEANRQDPGEAAPLADAATREATHAARVAALVRSVAEGERSPEDIAIGYETTIARVASAAGLEAVPIAGDSAAAEQLVTRIGELRQRADAAERELGERDRQVAGLEEEIRELDDRLGGAAAERDRLVMTLEAQRRAREQLAQLQALFTPAEGQVLREGDSIVLRLRGLTFQPGSARLGSSADRLLAKVEQAVAVFPRAALVVEGHTDNTGSESANRRLAEERAGAVAQALAGRLKLGPGRIQAIGYGEARPIASNDSAAGRTQNRRIDIVITPPAAVP